MPLMPELTRAPIEALEKTFFPPAQTTWFEWHDGQERRALVLDHVNTKPGKWPSELHAHVINESGFVNGLYFEGGALDNIILLLDIPDMEAKGVALAAAGLLAMINTPKLAIKVERPPHRGLQRELRRQPETSEIELRPWSEIRLAVTPKPHGESHEQRQVQQGKKCFHFCRSHLRVLPDRITVVSPHWRGNPALGVAQSTYRVTPPASPIPPQPHTFERNRP
jgi:hypothetical protein